MAWSTDAANSSTPVNESAYEGGVETWDDMDMIWNEVEGTWDNPRSPWKNEAANSSVITNEPANA